jgi:hypothetical protein
LEQQKLGTGYLHALLHLQQSTTSEFRRTLAHFLLFPTSIVQSRAFVKLGHTLAS